MKENSVDNNNKEEFQHIWEAMNTEFKKSFFFGEFEKYLHGCAKNGWRRQKPVQQTYFFL